MILINDITLIVLGALIVFLLVIFGIIQVKLKNNNRTNNEIIVEENDVVLEETNSLDNQNVISEQPTTILNETKQEDVQLVESKENIPLDQDEPESDEVIQNKRKGKYEIFKDSGFYRYRLKASNGEVLIESELYETEKAVTEAVEIVRKNVENGLYQIIEDKNDSFQYKLSSRNHRTLVVSTSYSSKKGAEDAKDAFRRNALTDVVVFVKSTKKVSKGTMEVYNDQSSVLDDKGLYEVFPNGKKYYFTLKNSKGIVLCQSSDFVSKTSCITGLETFRNVVYEGVFYICKDKNGKFQFKLYNKQNKLVMTGELLETKTKVQTVIRNVRKFAKLSKLA